MKHLLSLFTLFLFFQSVNAQRLSDAIRLNQIGFYPEAPNVVVVLGSVSGNFHVISPDFSDTLLTGELSEIADAPIPVSRFGPLIFLE